MEVQTRATPDVRTDFPDTSTTRTEHAAKVAAISRRVAEFHRNGIAAKIYHGSTNSTRAPRFDASKMIDASNLDAVIHIHTDGAYVLVEPNVPMDKLVEATLRHGLIPPVVMEFPGITVGGWHPGRRGRE